MARLAPILVLLLVGVAAIAVWWPWQPTETQAVLPAPGAESRRSATADALLTLPTESVPEGADTPREEVQLEPRPKTRGIFQGTTRLRMVHGITGEPVAGVRVLWASHDQIGELGRTSDHNSFDSVDVVLKEIGRVAHSDELGRVELEVPAPMLMFSAQHDELLSDKENVYTGRFGFSETEGYTDVLLFPRRALEIQVVDAFGVPQAGVGVCLRIDATGAPDGWTSLTPITKEAWSGVTQGDLGIARLEDVDARLRPYYEELRRKSPLKLFVDFRFPTHAGVAVRLDPLDWPAVPVRLVQPQSGSLTVLVLDANGLPTKGRGKVYVDAVDSIDRPSMRFGERELEGGRARIEDIPYEVPLDVNVIVYGTRDPIHRRVDGPTFVQPDVELVVVESPPSPLIVARLMDIRGEPIHQASLQVNSRSRAGDARALGSFWLTTRAGELEWPLATKIYEGGSVTLRFSAGNCVATRELRHELSNARIDLGDVQLEPVPEVASGKDAKGGH